MGASLFLQSTANTEPESHGAAARAGGSGQRKRGQPNADAEQHNSERQPCAERERHSSLFRLPPGESGGTEILRRVWLRPSSRESRRRKFHRWLKSSSCCTPERRA